MPNEQKKCKQCQLEDNRGACDRKDCSNHTPTEEKEWEARELTRNNMNPHQTEALRDEFLSWLNNPREFPPNEEMIAGWWLTELSQALEREREAVRKEIGSAQRIEDPSLTDGDGVNRDYLSIGWNLGLGRALEILSPTKTNKE